MRRLAFRSTVALATVLAFNLGVRAAPVSDDEGDTALVNQPAKPADSFGARMAHARAKKQTDGAKVKHARKPKAAKDKAPRIPRAPRVAKLPD